MNVVPPNPLNCKRYDRGTPQLRLIRSDETARTLRGIARPHYDAPLFAISYAARQRLHLAAWNAEQAVPVDPDAMATPHEPAVSASLRTFLFRPIWPGGSPSSHFNQYEKAGLAASVCTRLRRRGPGMYRAEVDCSGADAPPLLMPLETSLLAIPALRTVSTVRCDRTRRRACYLCCCSVRQLHGRRCFRLAHEQARRQS